MKIFNTKDFGSAVKNRRKKLGYTQKDVANFIGCSASFISDLENGKKTAEIEKSIVVATTLGMDLSLHER